MVDTKHLMRNFMAQYELNGQECARILGIRTGTFYNKMSRGSFTLDEFLKLVNYIHGYIAIRVDKR
jgi:DNA-binding NtrC family response regulator